MKERLAYILSAIGGLSGDELSHALERFEPTYFKKDEILIQAGSVCDWIAFVGSGIVRNFYTSSKDEEVTYCLTFPDKFITAYSSFISEERTFENIHALTDTELLIIRKKQFTELVDSDIRWLRFSNHFAEQSYVLMEHRLLALQMESAEKRYQDLIDKHPEYVQQVPLKYLASYLGITQRHLSRLRKKISF